MACITRRSVPVIISKCVERVIKVLRVEPVIIATHSPVVQIVREVKPCK